MRSFCDFGWNASQTAAVQRTKAQCALDSGEDLCMPLGETIQTDGPLYMRHGGRLSGSGSDIMQSGKARSMFRTAEIGSDILVVTGSHARISDIAFHRDGYGTGSGLVIGDGKEYTRAVIVEGVSANASNWSGVHLVGTGGTIIRDSWLWGSIAGLWVLNPINADAGDNKVTNVDLNAGPSGSGLLWESGGGLYVTACKFNLGKKHIDIRWHGGSSANFTLQGCSLESCSGISVDIDGNQVFKRMNITGNTWGVNSVAIAVRNFSPDPWLENLSVVGNTFSAGTDGSPIIDLGCVKSGQVKDNIFIGNGRAQCGVMLRVPGIGTEVGGNTLDGCAYEVLG